MKTYEKPKLIALSISGNSLLCSCDIDAVGGNSPITPEIEELIKISGGVAFTVDSNECTVIIEGVCKNTPTGFIVFNS